MKKSLVIGFVLTALFLMPLASAETELKVYTKGNYYKNDSTEPFYAEAGSKLILFAQLIIDGKIVEICGVYKVPTDDPAFCTDMAWGFIDPYTHESSENECMLFPTSSGKLFQCNIDVPETSGETDIRFWHSAGVRKRKLIVYEPCDGCLINITTCVPLGIRKEGMYCSIDNEFVGQKIEDEYCDNNFECKSNICVNDECVGESLIKRIFAWFKRIFGRD